VALGNEQSEKDVSIALGRRNQGGEVKELGKGGKREKAVPDRFVGKKKKRQSLKRKKAKGGGNGT